MFDKTIRQKLQLWTIHNTMVAASTPQTARRWYAWNSAVILHLQQPFWERLTDLNEQQLHIDNCILRSRGSDKCRRNPLRTQRLQPIDKKATFRREIKMNHMSHLRQ